MKNEYSSCIKKVEKGHPSVESLNDFLCQTMSLHNHYAGIKMMLEYYMFYELVSEEVNPYAGSIQDMTEELNQKIERFFETSLSEEEEKQLASEFLAMREEIIARMKVLTAYVDRYIVYEYVLNRVQYRFEDQEYLPEDAAFAKDLLNFVLSGRDNAAISDNIRFVIGQLPVRITRSKYYQMIQDSISVYQGSDKSSLDNYLYMFRTSAMLYQDENQGKYFTEFSKTLEELENLDYENITYEVYQIYSEKIKTQASKLQDISDLYMQLGQIINDMYILCITSAYGERQFDATVIRGINAFFQQNEGVWQQNHMEEKSELEKKEYLEGTFASIEGVQERLYDSLGLGESALDHLLESKQELLDESGKKIDFVELKHLFLLISNSVFADLQDKETEEKVTPEMAEHAAEELILECKKFFDGKSRMLRRAIMAVTLEKMPILFSNAQEIADYVMDSLKQCDDEAEKYASKQILLDMMVN